MNNSPHPHLDLSVTNFGPIASAEIDLRPLSVFIGPSNTGKSYLAILVYALHRFFSGYPTRRGPNSDDLVFSPPPNSRTFNLNRRLYMGRQGRLFPPQQGSDEVSTETVRGLAAWFKQITETLESPDTSRPPEYGSMQMPESLAAMVRTELRNVGDFGKYLEEEISRCFGISDTRTLKNLGSQEGAAVTVKRRIPHQEQPFEYRFAMNGGDSLLEASIPSQNPLCLVSQDSPRRLLFRLNEMLDGFGVENNDYSPSSAQLTTFLRQLVEAYTFDPLHRIAHYLPADRAGVMHAHQVVTRSLITRASRVSLQQDIPFPVLSGVLADFLEQLINFGSLPPERSPGRGRRLAERLEEEILQGTIELENSIIDYPMFSYRPKGWKTVLPLLNTSSMVTELAPVVMYLRHLVRPGDILIIEEPEAHLHPAAQAAFTKILARVVRSGVRVILTTHSEWILEQIANLVELSYLPAEKRANFQDIHSMSLNPEEVGVWLFNSPSGGQGTHVENIPFGFEGGFDQTGYEQVADSLYNEWSDISDHVPVEGSE